MADAGTDAQWPSEDEDFDAVADKATRAAKVSDKQSSSARSVAVSEPEPEEAEAPEPEDEAFEPEAEQEPEAAQEPEPAVEEVQPDAEPGPEVAAEQYDVAAVATKPPKTPGTSRLGKLSGRTILEFVLVVALILMGLWAWSLVTDNNNLKQQVSQLNANPQVAVQKQTQALINTVGKLIQLPTDETPTIANVSDASQAKQQSAFFANAQNGDKVLMYVKAGEAILYRPSTGKIILVAPLTFTNNSTSSSTTSNTTKK